MSKANGIQIYQRIKRLTEIRKISIKELANKVGFKSPSTIYNYKYNVTPGKASLNAIADALNTTPEYLLGETDDWQKHDVTPEQELGLDKDDQEMLALFRKSTDGMTEEEKEKFKQSFVKLLKVAKDLNS